jgi:hypothetical protein
MKSLRLYIITVASLLVIYVVAQYNRPKAIDWSETFSSTDKIPFGTYIIRNRITDIFPNAKVATFREPVYNVLNDHDIKHGTYLIITNAIDINEYDYDKLIKFIKNGNDVFISASYFGEQMWKNLKVGARAEFADTAYSSNIKFLNKYLDTIKYYGVEKGMSDGYFSSIDTSKAVVLGKNVFNHINFVKYAMGKGTLYLNANPLMFTNYSLFHKKGGEYASTALSFVKNDSNIMWDQYYSLGREDDGSTMRVFLRNPAMRWAFYIAFFSLVLFVLYEIKRRQRIIPVIKPLANETLVFVNVVGQVYYEQRDNKDISNKKTAYFLEHLRTTYYLKTNVLDDDFRNNLAQKTGIEYTLATDLVNHINHLNAQPHVTNHELIVLNQLIENFYTQSR